MIKYDLDGVLINIYAVIRELLRNAGYEIRDETTWRFETVPSLSRNQIWAFIDRAYPLWNFTPIYPGVRRLMRTMWEHTANPIQIITARPVRAAEHTHRIVQKIMEGIPYTLALVGTGADKLNYLEPRDILVEDRRKTVLHLARAGVRTYLIDKPYNQIPHEHRIPEITRISDIRAIITP